MRCTVTYATRERQLLWTVDLPVAATIADALRAARQIAAAEHIPWDTAPVGVFGELRSRADVLRDGDRVELYRPLRADPRQRRRDGVRTARRAGSGRRFTR